MIELIDIAAPALLVGLLIAVVHVPFGVEVLKRGIIFIDLAIAQIAALGYLCSEIVFKESAPFFSGLGAFTAAILGGMIFKAIENRQPDKQEAWIGVFFVVSASLSILVLSSQPHGAEELSHILSGQILFTSYSDFLTYLPIYLILFTMAIRVTRAMTGLYFYALFALTITLSVQVVGVYVVFASLIIPALVFSRYKVGSHTPYVFSACSILTGILGSTVFDVPAGPSLVVTYFLSAIFYISIRSLSSRRGWHG